MATSSNRVGQKDFDDWLDSRRQAHAFEIRRVPFSELDGWHFEGRTGNLAHRSGRFFRVEGLRVRILDGQGTQWHQPVIVQPEVGILGILMKRFNGEPHFLMQAKMEPGNPNLLQLSPTVQATRSNYMRVHKGADVRYLDYFRGARRGKVIADVLQSEHGWWFYRKRNRNIILETEDDVPEHEDFCWLTLDQINELMRRDNLVNMDSRTVLANLPAATVRPRGSGSADPFIRAIMASRDPLAGSLSTTPALLSWIVSQRSEPVVETARVGLRGLPGWYQTPDEIAREDRRHFRIVGVKVRADNREVTSWSQPLLEPMGVGIAAFIVKEFGGVLHVLVHSKIEGGFLDTIELGPTVQCRPGNYDEADAPLFLDYILAAGKSRIRFEAVHSEEGGRFLHAQSRYLVVEADDTLTGKIPDEYTWITLWQMADLLRHGGYLQVQARVLIACMNGLG